MPMVIDTEPWINYSLVFTGCQHVIRSVIIPSGQSAKVRIAGFSQEDLELAEGTTIQVSPPVDAGLLASKSAPVQTHLVVTCSDGTQEKRPVVVLPLCAWDQRRIHAKATAAFVLENDPFVLRVLRKANLPSPEGDPPTCTAAKRLYEQVADSFEVCYLYERGSVSDYGDAQLLRFPAQMHYDIGGTCIDLVLLFTALFRGAGLQPVILLLGEEYGYRHALSAVWCGAPACPDVVVSPKTLREEIAGQRLLVLETTWLTQDKSFEEAVSEGQRRALSDKILWGIDVTAARQGESLPRIGALPEQPCITILSGLPNRITDPFTATRTTKATEVSRTFRLEVTAGSDRRDAGHRWKLDGYAIRIGRTPHNHIVLHDLSVSREHAVLFSQDGQEGTFFVKDLGSRHGTTVEGRRLEPYRPYGLSRGQRFKVGDVELRLT